MIELSKTQTKENTLEVLQETKKKTHCLARSTAINNNFAIISINDSKFYRSIVKINGTLCYWINYSKRERERERAEESKRSRKRERLTAALAATSTLPLSFEFDFDLTKQL